MKVKIIRWSEIEEATEKKAGKNKEEWDGKKKREREKETTANGNIVWRPDKEGQEKNGQGRDDETYDWGEKNK